MASENDTPVSAAEAGALFSDLQSIPVLLLAVSGGPDSIALMVLAARWAQSLKRAPKLVVATVDHGLRKEARREAADVAKLARKLGLTHRILKWSGQKPATGLQQAARLARYRLLAAAARKAGAAHILTAHTLDDQAETVLIRLSRGSGIAGLGAMQRVAVIPGRAFARTRNPDADVQGSGFRVRGQEAAPRNDEVSLVRPLLDLPKARLIATVRAAKIPFAEDPSNRDPRFTRARLRGLMPQLAEEGLDARRLSQFSRRAKRVDAAIEAMVEGALAILAAEAPRGAMAFKAGWFDMPAEVSMRALGRAIDRIGDEGPVELGKLEALFDALKAAQKSGIRRYRRSLAGAVVTLADSQITVETAPPRHRRPNPVPKRRRRPLTKGGGGRAGKRASAAKSR